MKKYFSIFAFFTVFMYTNLFAQQSGEHTSLIVEVDSDAWRSGTVVHRSNNVTRILPQGTEVLGDWTGFRSEIDGVFDDMAFIFFENNLYSIRARNLSPIGEGRFSRNWITPPDAQERWTLLYFLDALRSQDRDTVLNYEQAWADWIERLAHPYEVAAGINQWWRGRRVDDVTSLIFFDAVVSIGGFSRRTSFIQDIIPYSIGYKITLNSIPADPNDLSFPPSSLPFPFSSERPNFDLIFIPDGDYMDVYLDSLNNHFATFVNIDVALLEELVNLIQNNTVDLSNIASWPRRADGRMDIPPPVDMSGFQATHMTTARLNVRDSSITTAPLVTTLEIGMEVQVLETGLVATIGEITAPWVRVLSADGFTGWCFSGFLEVVVVAAVDSPLVEAPTFLVSQSVDVAESGIPSRGWLAVGGGVMAVGVAVFVARRKRG